MPLTAFVRRWPVSFPLSKAAEIAVNPTAGPECPLAFHLPRFYVTFDAVFPNCRTVIKLARYRHVGFDPPLTPNLALGHRVRTGRAVTHHATLRDMSPILANQRPPQGGTAEPILGSHMVAVLQRQATVLGDKVAFRFISGAGREDVELSYCGLRDRAMAIAAELQSRVDPGARVLLAFPSGLDFVEAFFGCLFAGVVAVPISQPGRRRPITAVQSICAAAKPALVLGSADREEAGATTAAELSQRLGLTWLASDRIPTQRLGDWCEPQVSGEDTAFLQFTSGSTSDPKGVVLSHQNVLSNAGLIQQAFGTSDDSSAVFWLPLHHDMGLIGGVVQPMYCGGTSTLLAPAAFLQRPALWLETISRLRATISGGPDFAYGLCTKKITQAERDGLDLSSWKVAFTGAERIRPQTLQRFSAGFAACGFRPESVFPCYGLAEATLMATGGPCGVVPTVVHLDPGGLAEHVVKEVPRDAKGAVSFVGCGNALAGQRVVIVDPQLCRPCPDGRVGEIWVQGKSVSSGYYENPEATARVFGARLAEGNEGEFLRTGDLGFSRDGQIFVTGRLKDLIIVRGRNYYPEDIEYVVERADANFRAGHCAAFSVEVEQEERLVVVQEVDPRSRGLDGPAACQAVRQAIAANFEVEIHSIVLTKAGMVPKTTSGKRRRAACREFYLRDQLETQARWTAEVRNEVPSPTANGHPQLAHQPTAKEIERWLLKRIAERLGLTGSQIDVDKPFLEMGMGSLDAVEVAADLQDWLGHHLSPTAIYNYPSISCLANWLAKPAGKPTASEQQPAVSSAISLMNPDVDPDSLLREVQGLSEEDMNAFIMASMTQQPREA